MANQSSCAAAGAAAGSTGAGSVQCGCVGGRGGTRVLTAEAGVRSFCLDTRDGDHAALRGLEALTRPCACRAGRGAGT